jgi:hypothetical protein
VAMMIGAATLARTPTSGTADGIFSESMAPPRSYRATSIRHRSLEEGAEGGAVRPSALARKVVGGSTEKRRTR